MLKNFVKKFCFLFQMLIKFVKKRDKRVKIHREILAKENAEQAIRIEENIRRQRIKNREDLQAFESSSKIFEDELHQRALEEIEALYDSAKEENSETNEDEEDLMDNLFCVACEKVIKKRFWLNF